MPFKAHNSSYVGEPEHLRDRVWHLTIAQANLKTIENSSIEDKMQVIVAAKRVEVIDGLTCFKIQFRPKREQDLAFVGTMWISDSTFALKQIEATADAV